MPIDGFSGLGLSEHHSVIHISLGDGLCPLHFAGQVRILGETLLRGAPAVSTLRGAPAITRTVGVMHVNITSPSYCTLHSLYE